MSRAAVTRSARTTMQPLWLPLAFIAALGLSSMLPRIAAIPQLRHAFWGADAALAAWWAILVSRAGGRRLRIDVELRPQHYLQAVAHASIFIYWSFYWPPIADALPLIAAQIAFSYAFDWLLVFSRRDTYTLGFGPFPIIFSTNLFLRFHDDWFALQFAMIALGFVAKELIRWQREGRSVHVFNPSSFPLAIASVVLILTHTTDHTWGEGIATQLFLPPQIFFFIFLVALPGQYLFGVSKMTLSAVLTTYAFSEIYFRATGTYFFIDDHVPIAVFLGMHLLFTDPSTSPSSEQGRVLFGVIYGLSVVALYSLLARLGAPTFYDKLLPVPIMNLLVPRIDRLSASGRLSWMDPSRIGRGLAPMRRNLVYTLLWVVTFGAMSAAGGLGDTHPGHRVPFWMTACREGRRDGCNVLEQIENRYCSLGSGWACNDLGVLMSAGKLKDNSRTSQAFERACALGFAGGCANQALPKGAIPTAGDPGPGDLVLLLREGKGSLPPLSELELKQKACLQGWIFACYSR